MAPLGCKEGAGLSLKACLTPLLGRCARSLYAFGPRIANLLPQLDVRATMA